MLAVLLVACACVQALNLARSARARKRSALAMGRAETGRMAGTIDGLLRTLEPEVRSLAADVSAGRVADRDLPARIERGLARTPAAFRMGIDFKPYAKDPHKLLYSIDVVRENGAMHTYREVDSVNYTVQNWFLADLSSEGWHEPHLSRTTHQVVAGFSMFIRKPGDRNGPPIGVLRMDLSLGAIRQIMSTASLGRTGYSCLLSPGGTFLAHPRHDWVAEERNLFQVAQDTGDEALWRCAELALRRARGEVATVSYTGGHSIQLFSEPIPSAGWTLQSAVFAEDAALGPGTLRQGLMGIAVTLMGAAICLGLASLAPAAGVLGALGHLHGLVSTLLAAGICLLWGLALTYPDPATDSAVPILSQEQLENYLATRNPNEGAVPGRRMIRVPTGVFLKTLRMDNPNDVVVTGLVWQHYPPDFPKELNRGFLCANAESQESTIAFQRKDAGGELVEYNFRATLRQDFDRAVKYPFDQALLAMPLLPCDFESAVSLVPDLDAYHVLNPAALPGVDKGLVLPGWYQERSYFGFQEWDPATTFGRAAQDSAERPPVLSYQLTLSRQFLNPFISAMLPVIVVGCLMYTLLLVGTKDHEKARTTGFKAIDILAAAATLLFPLIYAQISLRSRIASSSLLYLEYFYFVMYAVILMVAANALAFALGKHGLVDLQDNALAKLAYWPLVLGTFFLTSLVFLY
jgi:hypothetical protein